MKKKPIAVEQLTFKQYRKTKKKGRKHILCISPNLEDTNLFSGIWLQNSGLLKIASYLKNVKKLRVTYIDGLNPQYFSDGKCKISKKLIERKEIGGGVRKNVYLWGYSYDELFQKIKEVDIPDKIYIGVTMTYWYRSVFKIVKLCKKMYPDVPILIGGISPTLIPDWYKKFIKKNGWTDVKIIVGDWNKGKAKNEWTDFDLLRPNVPNFAMISTSHGCPFNCSFCARKRLNPKIQVRDPDDVIGEMKEKYKRYGVRRFYIIDDNIIVHRKGKHLLKFLNLIIRSGMKIELGLVEGFSPHLLTEELIEKMHKAGCRRLYFGFESSDKAMLDRFNKKHTLKDLYKMRKWAWKHGFKKHDGISFYTLVAMPDQSLESMVASLLECVKFGAQPVPKEFTPIPFTAEWEKYGHLVKKADPFDLNGDFYPFAEYNKHKPSEYEEMQALVQGLRKMLSYSFHLKRMDLSSNRRLPTIIRKMATKMARDRKRRE